MHTAAREAEHALRAGGGEGYLGHEVFAAQAQARGDDVGGVDIVLAALSSAPQRVHGFRDAVLVGLFHRRQRSTLLRRSTQRVLHRSKVVAVAVGVRANAIRPLGHELEFHRVDLVVLHLPVVRREVVVEGIRGGGASHLRRRRILRPKSQARNRRLVQKVGDVEEVQRREIHTRAGVQLRLLIHLGSARGGEIEEGSFGGEQVGEHTRKRARRVGSRHRGVGARDDEEPLGQPQAPQVEARGGSRGAVAGDEEDRGHGGE